jgi:hypothetical protein
MKVLYLIAVYMRTNVIFLDTDDDGGTFDIAQVKKPLVLAAAAAPAPALAPATVTAPAAPLVSKSAARNVRNRPAPTAAPTATSVAAPIVAPASIPTPVATYTVGIQGTTIVLPRSAGFSTTGKTNRCRQNSDGTEVASGPNIWKNDQVVPMSIYVPPELRFVL